MADLIEFLGLAPAIGDAGFSSTSDFGSLYDDIATSGKAPRLKAEIEGKVQAYFETLEVPESPTLYDYLVLSLRDSDYIATFHWDPFLAKLSCGTGKPQKRQNSSFYMGTFMLELPRRSGQGFPR